MLTGRGLAVHALSLIGTPYFYGSKLNILTEDFMQRMHHMYPNIVTSMYMETARKQGQVGKINVDCSGLIGSYRKKQIGSSQLYATAKKRLPISQVNDFAIGTVLWKTGHVGVYVGNGMCVEARSIKYGTIKTKVADQKWVYGLTFADIEYDYDVPIKGTSPATNPYNEPKTVLKLGSTGDGVRWLQFELNEAGFNLAVDGDFGNKTLSAVLAFQASCKIEVDGKVGNITRACLKG